MPSPEFSLPRPLCAGCHKLAEEIASVVMFAEQEGQTPEEYARQDGTYNSANGHFLCDGCYVRAGMPSSPTGWVCP